MVIIYHIFQNVNCCDTIKGNFLERYGFSMKNIGFIKNVRVEAKSVILTVVAALFSIVALHSFVVPGNFASSGIDGLCTILYEITDINMGWFKLFINVPLLILAIIFLNRKYTLYVIFFTALDSIGVILLEKLNFFIYIPEGLASSELIGYRLIAALISGILLGICVGIMLRIGYSSGGVDIIAGLVHKWKPHFNVERVISICAYTIVGMSYFVYHDLTSIALSAIQIFVSERVIAAILRRTRFATEVRIVTKEPEKIRDDILYRHRHGATVIRSEGMYSGEENWTVITVMNNADIPEFINSMKRYPETFVYFTGGVRVQGDFHFSEDEIGLWLEAFR